MTNVGSRRADPRDRPPVSPRSNNSVGHGVQIPCLKRAALRWDLPGPGARPETHTAYVIAAFDTERRGSTVDLRLIVGLDEQPALAVLDLADAAGPGTHLQLRLLEAGHQVLLRTPHGLISETLARLPADHEISGATEQEIAGRLYRFQGKLDNSARMVRDMVYLYAGAWEDQPNALCAMFAGDPRGIASVQVELRGHPKLVKWTAVHTYPESGQALWTKSSVTVLSGAP